MFLPSASHRASTNEYVYGMQRMYVLQRLVMNMMCPSGR
jgi:hypothetical protein